jgi:hypothetical protein
MAIACSSEHFFVVVGDGDFSIGKDGVAARIA